MKTTGKWEAERGCKLTFISQDVGQLTDSPDCLYAKPLKNRTIWKRWDMVTLDPTWGWKLVVQIQAKCFLRISWCDDPTRWITCPKVLHLWEKAHEHSLGVNGGSPGPRAGGNCWQTISWLINQNQNIPWKLLVFGEMFRKVAEVSSHVFFPG